MNKKSCRLRTHPRRSGRIRRRSNWIGRLYLGQIGLDPASGELRQDFEAQVGSRSRIWRRWPSERRITGKRGEVHFVLDDLGQFAKPTRSWRVVPKPYPARSTVGSPACRAARSLKSKRFWFCSHWFPQGPERSERCTDQHDRSAAGARWVDLRLGFCSASALRRRRNAHHADRDLIAGNESQVEAEVLSCDVVFRGKRQLRVTVARRVGSADAAFLNFYSSQIKQMAVGRRFRIFGVVRGGLAAMK